MFHPLCDVNKTKARLCNVVKYPFMTENGRLFYENEEYNGDDYDVIDDYDDDDHLRQQHHRHHHHDDDYNLDVDNDDFDIFTFFSFQLKYI